MLRTASHNHHWRIFKFAVDLVTLLSQMQLFRVAAGDLIVLVLLGSLDLVARATAITTQPNLSELTRESSPVSGMQSEVIPLPTRKPQVVDRVSDETGAIPVTQKRVAQRKSAGHKPKS